VQSFTVPKSSLSLEAWREVRHAEFDVLEADAHSRKLPRGALAGNRFIIRIRETDISDTDLTARIAEISRLGVPNYFGPQRFGHGGANLARIADGLRALRSHERGFVLSAARSLVFNAVLAARVRDGSWNHLETGDIANLDGRGSIFPVDPVDQTLIDRAAQLDVHPTGPLWGRGDLASKHRVLDLESRTAADFPQPCALTLEAGMDQERRSLRLAVRELSWNRDSDANSLVIRFRLTRGSFATTVLRQLIDSDSLGDEDQEGS
jgi:tRNA pseudouridine13 synthase